MAPKQDDNEIKVMLASIDGKIDMLASEQHSIKEKVEKIETKVDSTTEKGLNNSSQIEFLKERFDERKAEDDKKRERIYENMDKKSDETMRKVKVWLYSTIASIIGIPIIGYIFKELVK